MKFTKIALTLMCSTVLFCGCAKNTNVVLKINDTEITRASFYGDLAKIRNIQLNEAPREVKNESSYASLALKSRYTNDVIIRALLEQDFAKRKIEATEKEIADKKDSIVKTIGSKEEFDKKLKENGISEERLNKDLSNEVKVEKLIKQITGSVKVSDSEIEKFYKENKAQFTTTERVQVSHILFDTNPDNIKRAIVEKDKEGKISPKDIDSQVKQEISKKETMAKDLANQLSKNPKKFAEFAQKYSDDPGSAQKGGDLGFITRESVVKEFGDVAFVQKVGTISPLVKTQFGLHIIYVRDKAAAGTQSLAKVKNDLRVYLTEKKKADEFQKYIEGLKNEAKIEYIDESLKPDILQDKLQKALQKQLNINKNKFAPQPKQKVLEKAKEEKAEK